MRTVYAVGAGVRGIKQLTLESISILSKVDKVLFFPFETITSDWLHDKLKLKNVESLANLYVDGDTDWNNYDRVTKHIIENAANYQEIAVLMPGHPRLGVSWIKKLNNIKNKYKIDLVCIEGISSFDTMFNDMSKDPLDQGSVLIDVNRMLLYELIIEPRMDYYFYHICSTGNTKTNFNNPSLGNNLDLLKNYLLKFYENEHEIILIESKRKNSQNSIAYKTTVENISDLKDHISVATSLFIPGIKEERTSETFSKLLKKSV